MYINFFNSFKERLANGEVPNEFWVDCYPVKQSFFEKYNTDEYKIENFRTMDDLERLGFEGTQFGYNQKLNYADYCCEYLTEPQTFYKDRVINGSPYKVIETQRYNYLSAQMNYSYHEVQGQDTYKAPSASIARGLVSYDYTNQMFLVHFFNHTENKFDGDFKFANNCCNDGTTLWMGYIPDKQEMVNQLCQNGVANTICPIYGKDFRGFVFADTSGHLIKYIDFETAQDFNGGSFVYQYPDVITINNKETNQKVNWATFAKLY